MCVCGWNLEMISLTQMGNRGILQTLQTSEIHLQAEMLNEKFVVLQGVVQVVLGRTLYSVTATVKELDRHINCSSQNTNTMQVPQVYNQLWFLHFYLFRD